MSSASDFVIENGVLKKYVGSDGDVVIPEGVCRIDDEVFKRCIQLKNITIPNSVTSIGKNAFESCLCLTNLVIPDSVIQIGDSAFMGCRNIHTLKLPARVMDIGAYAFAMMDALKEVILPKRLTILKGRVFWSDSQLSCVIWPDNLRRIEDGCFQNCGIEHLQIPQTVEWIGDEAFANIKAATAVLPKTIKAIGKGVFAGVPNIEVYDTIDSDAKPAAEHSDAINGFENGKVGVIGIADPPYSPLFRAHVITVRSASDDTVKYRVHMPEGQNRKVACTFASSWGKNAQFNFAAVEAIFKDLTAEAKVDYLIDRLRYTEVPKSFESTVTNCVVRSGNLFCNKIMAEDDEQLLRKFESYRIVTDKTIDERLQQAESHNATLCKARLLEWKNQQVSPSESEKITAKLSMRGPTVAEMKKIWPHKKRDDGSLVITGYRGEEIDVIIPDMIGKTPVTAIGGSCFSNAHKKIQSITMPDTVDEIGGRAFACCTALEEVKLPKGLKVLESGLFSGCLRLNVSIPDGIEEIRGEGVFDECPSEVLNIPASVQEISEHALGFDDGGIPTLAAVHVDSKNQKYCDVDGVLFSKDKKMLIRYPRAKADEVYYVPEGVTAIAANAFACCTGLKKLILPNTVEIIRECAFVGCTSLEQIQMPKKMVDLQSAFYECSALREIVIPEGITNVADNMFELCANLEKVTLPAGLKKIGIYAFSECDSLRSVDLPKSVRTIGEGAFQYCKAMEYITIPSGAPSLNDWQFSGCPNLTVYTPVDSKTYRCAKDQKIQVLPLEEKPH